MCLPTWDSVLGYEEGREKVMKRLRTGYPRFFKHPAVERLFEKARDEVAGDGEDVLVLPTRASVLRAHRWIERRAEAAIRITSFHGLQVLVFPEKARQAANDYWRFTGEIVSSRQAQDLLESALREGSKSHLIARSMSKITGAAEDETFIFSSGMSAVTAVIRALPGVREGRKTLQIEFPYVDCLKVQERFGNGVVYLNEAEGESFDEALRRIRTGEFAGVFTEVPGNPLLRTADLGRISDACRFSGTPLIIDDSSSGPANVDALKYADACTSSLTKWVSGAGDVMAGAVSLAADSPHAGALREALAEDSAECAPLYIGDAEVLLSNLKGYRKRMGAINGNGLELAGWLATHPAVAKVFHPSLDTHAAYDAARRPQGGYGGLISFTLKAPKKTPRVYDALRFSKGPSFGTDFTLVCPYTLLAHYDELEWAEGCGVSANLLRVSCGLEPSEEIISRFAEAFELA